MRFHWLRDRSISQKQFRFYWCPGPMNYADYWMKHHPAAHHHNMQLVFRTPFSQLLEFRKKVNNLIPQGLKKIIWYPTLVKLYCKGVLDMYCIHHIAGRESSEDWEFKWIISPKALPHGIWIFLCRYRKMYYYSTPTAVFTLIIMTILAYLCLPFNHITYLVMYYCSIAFTKSV